jgi:hypothetical protein
MALFQDQFLTDYYGNDTDLNEASYEELTEKLESNSEESTNLPTSCLPSILGEGLGSMVNNPKFARFCNPLDTEFEVAICDELVNKLGLPEDFLYNHNGLGIINACETDGLLSLLITAKFSKREYFGEDIQSDKFILYCSEREALYSIRRVAQMCDVTLKTFTDLYELKSLIETDKQNELFPLMIIHDTENIAKEQFENDTFSLSQICEDENIW